MIKENRDFITIDFTGLFKVLIRKLWLMMFIGALAAGCAWGIGHFMAENKVTVPEYRSTVKLYITGNETSSPSSNAKLLGQSFFADFCELMKSNKVTSHVLEDLGLNMTKSQLLGCVRTQWVSSTCMAYVSVTFPDAQLSKQIVDDLIRVTSAYALEIIGMTPPKVYEEAVVPTSPLNVAETNLTKHVIFGFAGGFLVAAFAVVLAFLSDRKIRTPEQLSNRLSLPVYGAYLKGKGKWALRYNGYAMQHLQEKLYVGHKDAKTIAFINLKNEKKEALIGRYGHYLQEIGKKVILLDTRMLAPAGENGNGLLEFLQEKTKDLKKIVYEKDGIDCIDCSDKVMNSVEYLDSAAFARLLKTLREEYDYVLINTASLANTSEALVIMKQSDINLLYVECNRTQYPACEAFIEETGSETTISAVIFGRVKGNAISRRFQKEFSNLFSTR